jgi:hypothetical protein
MIRTVLVTFASIAVAASTIAAGISTEAPADEYFGPFKYSALSVRTKIDALGRAYNERWEDDASIVHDAGLLESSLRVWAQRYPKDTWLAPTAYHLAQLYQEIQTPQARTKARQMYQFLAATFPASKEAHFARLRLQQGFPALHPESPVSPTPYPYASAAPSASAAPATSPAPAAGPSGAPPAPAPAASAPPATSAPATAAPATSAPATSAPATSPAPASSPTPRTSPAATTAAPVASPVPAASASPKPKG